MKLYQPSGTRYPIPIPTTIDSYMTQAVYWRRHAHSDGARIACALSGLDHAEVRRTDLRIAMHYVREARAMRDGRRDCQ